MALKGAVAFITQDWNSTMCIVNYEERPINKNLLLTVGIWAPYTLYKLHNVWFIRFVWETENIKKRKQTNNNTTPEFLACYQEKEIDDMTSHFKEKMIYIKMSLIL